MSSQTRRKLIRKIHMKKVNIFVLLFLICSVFISNFGIVNSEQGGNNNDVLSFAGLSFEDLNATWNTDGVRLINSYVDLNLTAKQVFVPDELNDLTEQFTYYFQEWHEDQARFWITVTYNQMVGSTETYGNAFLNTLLGNVPNGSLLGNFTVYDYTNSVLYNPGDIVIYDGSYYQCKQQIYNYNGLPDALPQCWALVEPVENNIYPANRFQISNKEVWATNKTEKGYICDIDDFTDSETGFNVSWDITVRSYYYYVIIDYNLCYTNYSINGTNTTENNYIVYSFQDVYKEDIPSFVIIDDFRVEKIEINPHMENWTLVVDGLKDRVRLDYDNLYGDNHSVNVTIAYPSNKSDGFLGFYASDIWYEYENDLYNVVTDYANNSNMPNTVVSNPSDYVFRSYKINVSKDSIEHIYYEINSSDKQNNNLFMWLTINPWGGGGGASGSWGDYDWGYRKKITIDSGQVPSTITNFPVPINITDTDLKDHAQSDGDDILFANDTGTKLNHEIEYWNDSTGELVAWVNVTSLAHDSDTEIYMYYGNDTCDNQENVADTWGDDCIFVYHGSLNNDGDLVDSTGNYNATHGNNPVEATGAIGYGVDLESSDMDYFYNSYDADGAFSIFSHFRIEDTDDTNRHLICGTHAASNDNHFNWYPNFDSGGVLSYYAEDGSNYVAGTTTGTVTIGSYYFASFCSDDDGNAKAFLNAEKSTDSNPSFDTMNTDSTLYIGRQSNTNARFFDGILDELQYYNTYKSDDWITTEFNSITNATDGGFFTLGSEETSNNAPVFSNPNPSNNSVGNPLGFTWNITISDPDGDVFNWSIVCNNTQSNSANAASNGSKTLNLSGLTMNTTYTIWVNATDGNDTVNETFSFTTINFAGGDGSAGNPFTIDKIEHLYNIRYNMSANYSLIADLDFENDSDYVNSSHKTGNITGTGWSPIGNLSNSFVGVLNGNNHTINNLFINRSNTYRVGLFGYGNFDEIKNIGVIDANVTGKKYVGVLIGYIDNNGYINNSYTNGEVNGTETGSSIVGGFVGGIEDSIIINRCYSNVNVTSEGYNVGGFVGYHYKGIINNSYATGSVNSNNDTQSIVGGFCGYISQADIYNCFSNGTVTGSGSHVSGFNGYSFSDTWTISNCFWDTETSGQDTSDGGTGKTTDLMKTFDTFDNAGWDIDSDASDLNNGYPYLAWQNNTMGYVWLIAGSPPSTPSGTVNATTGIDYDAATFKGYLSDDGDDSNGCWVRFQYCRNNTNFDTEGTSTGWQTAKYTGTEISKTQGSLNPASLYYVRMQINNSVGWYNTSSTSFMTEPIEFNNPAPTYFNNYNGTLKIVAAYSETDYRHCNYTVARYKTDTYPSSITDGIEIFNGTRTSPEYLWTIYTNTVPYNTTLYISVWNVANWSNPNHFQPSNKEDTKIHTPVEHKNRVLTDSPTNIENNSVTFNLNLSEDGGLDNWVNFEYGTDKNYGSHTTNLTGKTEGLHNQNVNGLTPGQFYFVRSRANNTNVSIYGDDPYSRWIFSGTYDLVYLPEYVFSYNSTINNDPSGDNIFASVSGTLSVYYANLTTDSWDVYNPVTSDDIKPFTYNTDYLVSNGNEDNVTIYFDDIVFLTRPSNTSGIGSTSGIDWINVSWTKGSGANTSVLVRKQGGYPSSPSDGTEVYNGTDSYYNDTGLAGTYFYRVWSWANWSYDSTEYTQWSSGYSEISDDATNQIPVLSSENPTNNSVDVDKTQSTVSITIEDGNGHLMNWSIEVSNGDSNSANSEGNGSKSCSLTTPLSFNTVITWYVNCTDGYDSVNESYTFTTRSQYIPSAPSSFSASTVDRDTIELSWDDNDQNNTVIEWNTAASWTRGDGTEIYNGTGTSFTHEPLSYNTQYFYQAWSYNSTDVVYSTTNSSSNDTTDINLGQVLSSENPSNNSASVDITQSSVSVTINDPEGDTFNWSIEVSTGDSNSANNENNGSKSCSLTTPLAYNTVITWWVNSTDGYNNTNETFYFYTTTFIVYETLTFGGKCEVEETIVLLNTTINGSSNTEETNTTLFGFLTNNNSNDTTCWFQWKAESSNFTTPDGNESVGVKTEGESFSLNATPLLNGTFYYARTAANSSEGWNYSWNTTYFITKPQPATDVLATEIDNGINITWTHGDGYNASYLVVNETHVPDSRTDGTNIYYGEHNWFEHTSVEVGQTYYYRVWEYANWTDPLLYQWSDGDYNTSGDYSANQPILKYPNPENESADVSVSTVIWNITIESPKGRNFNWTIESAVGSNSTDEDSNGSKNIYIYGNLSYLESYTVWVNASESANNNWTNKTYTFTVEDNPAFSWTTLTFGGKVNVTGTAPILSNEEPTNQSTGVNMYPMLNITVSEPQSQTVNVTWLSNKTGSWIPFAYNTTVGGGATNTFRQRALWANESNTIYGWQVRVNDTDMNWANDTFWFETATYTWTNWSAWWTFNYTCCSPNSFVATAYNKTAINLTWAACDSADSNYLVVNESGWASYPLSITNGTLLYNGTNISYNHTSLVQSTTYYYTIWGWNETEGNYSIINNTASATTEGEITVFGPYPANESTGNDRPPVNISLQINGSSLDIYYYYWNMTCWPNAWNLLYEWSGVDTARYKVTSLDNNWSKSFIWGNHDYNWTVNVTDGVTWHNTSYIYTTKGSRYDVTNTNDVVSEDVSAAWLNRQGQADYDGIYDVDHTGDIVSEDISVIWANKT